MNLCDTVHKRPEPDALDRAFDCHGEAECWFHEGDGHARPGRRRYQGRPRDVGRSRYAASASMPSPVVHDTLNISALLLSFRMSAMARSMSNFTYGSRSVLLMTTASARTKRPGYLMGFSSPSATDSTASFSSSPRSYDDGHTRFPTFSMTSSRTPVKDCCLTISCIMCAVRWQEPLVSIWIACAPALSSLSLSSCVWMSPVITRRERPILPASASRMDVLPDPGELIMLTTAMPASLNRFLFCCATASLSAWALFSSRIFSGILYLDAFHHAVLARRNGPGVFAAFRAGGSHGSRGVLFAARAGESRRHVSYVDFHVVHAHVRKNEVKVHGERFGKYTTQRSHGERDLLHRAALRRLLDKSGYFAGD